MWLLGIVYRSILITSSLLVGILLPITLAFAQDSYPPMPIQGPRLSPPASPYNFVADNHEIYNDLIVRRLTPQSRAADIANTDMDKKGRPQEQPGRGVWQAETGLGSGLTLYYPKTNVCNDFNKRTEWRSHAASPSDIWSDSYAGWGTYAFDDKRLYRANNIIFSLEQVIGPGNKFNAEQYAIKIASGQPYAAGLGSPIIAAPPGAVVQVSVKYMIFDHDTNGQDYDWASLGLKPDAENLDNDAATFVNGYVRGAWAELTHSIVAGESGKIMILLQAHSPAALNSNIYFDDIQVVVDGEPISDCTYEQSLP